MGGGRQNLQTRQRGSIFYHSWPGGGKESAENGGLAGGGMTVCWRGWPGVEGGRG